MKVKVAAQVWVEEEIEIPDKFQKLVQSRKNIKGLGGFEQLEREYALRNECVNLCKDMLSEKYGGNLNYESVSVYDMVNNTIYQS